MCELQLSNLIETVTTNNFDLIKFELAFMNHIGSLGANVLFLVIKENRIRLIKICGSIYAAHYYDKWTV